MLKKIMSLHKNKVIIIITLLILIFFITIYFKNISKSKNSNLNKKEDVVTASVKTGKIEKKDFHKKLQSYGSIKILSQEQQFFSLDFPVKIKSIFISKGQFVKKGEPLFSASPSTEMLFQLKKAQSAVKFLKKDYNLILKKYNLKLATEQELISSELSLKEAKLNLQNLKKQGVSNLITIKSISDGIVLSINVSIGQNIFAKEKLLTTAPIKNFKIVFGIESDDRDLFHVGQQVKIQQLSNKNSKETTGKIVSITNLINPQTRLLTAIATPDNPQKLILNSFVNVVTEIVCKSVLVVPKSAVLPEEDHFKLFTIKDGNAVYHNVQILQENDEYVAIIGKNLSENDLVVTLGNYELQDGMKTKEIN